MPTSVLRKLVNERLGVHKVLDILHTFQQDRVSLQKPCATQDVVQGVASWVLKSHLITLTRVALTWKASSDLKEMAAFQPVEFLHHLHSCNVFLKDLTMEIGFQSVTCQPIDFHKCQSRHTQDCRTHCENPPMPLHTSRMVTLEKGSFLG